MLKRLMNTRARVARPAPAVPANTRVYAIGDVHGCLAQLDKLLAAIDADDAAQRPVARTALIFLGDLVDRGPSSAHVIDRVMTLAATRPGCRFLKGNHEEVFLAACDGDRAALRMFCRIGGRETAMSYGASAEEYERMDYDELAGFLAHAVPPEHLSFLAACEDMVIEGGYAFVHAGVRPRVALAQQSGADLRWIRQAFLSHVGGFEKVIVHGHSISDGVNRGCDRIGIDTGAYLGGPLTALALEGTTQRRIATLPIKSAT